MKIIIEKTTKEMAEVEVQFPIFLRLERITQGMRILFYRIEETGRFERIGVSDPSGWSADEYEFHKGRFELKTSLGILLDEGKPISEMEYAKFLVHVRQELNKFLPVTSA